MNNRKAIVAFSRALMSVGDDRIEGIVRFVSQIAEAARSSERVVQFLNHPGITPDEKLDVLKEASGVAKLPDELTLVMTLVCKRRQASFLPAILEEMTRILQDRQGILDVQVATAISLTDADKTKISTAIAAIIDSRLSTRFVVQPELVAGMRVRIGNTVYDHSAANALEQIKQSFGTL